MDAPAIDPRDEVFTLQEAAAFLRMSTSYIEHSDVPRARKGRSVRYLRSQLLAWVAKDLTHRVTHPAA